MADHSKKPYRLPEPLVCDIKDVTGSDGLISVSMEIAEKYIRKHEEYLRRYKYLDAMYKGFHDVFKAPEKPEWKPDNRLAVNFAKYVTDTFMGYGYGIPPKVICNDESAKDSVRDFLQANDFGDLFFEIGKKAAIFGHSFIFVYQDEDTHTRITDCSPEELFVVYDDTMKKRALFMIRDGYHENGDRYGEICTRERIEPFEKGRKLTNEAYDNPYGLLPCVEFRLNDERMGVFECETGMNELYNRTLGEKGNDVDAFAEAYLEILGVKVDEDGVRRIRDDRVINFYGTDDAKEILVNFLQKPTADATQENLLDRLEKLTFMMSMVANISDTAFGSATSGVSLAYKLWSTSNLALTFDRKAKKSIRKCFKIWASLSTNATNPDVWKEIDVKFTRNIPHNTAEETQTAVAADGLVSKKTQLGLLSYVDDPDAELEEINAEADAEIVAQKERATSILGFEEPDLSTPEKRAAMQELLDKYGDDLNGEGQ